MPFDFLPATYDRVDGLDGPPDTDKGEIVVLHDDVTLQAWNPGRKLECQHCRELALTADPHLMATIRIYTGFSLDKFVRPRFCSRGCWAAWAAGMR